MTEKQTVKIAEASEHHLRWFAENHLGISLPHHTRVEVMRSKVQAAWDKDEIPLPPDDAEGFEQDAAPARPIKRAAAKPPGGGQKDVFYVRIAVQDTFDGRERVPLGCNGRVILVPRGEWCEVPMKFYDSLVNAVEVRYEPLPDGGLGPPIEVPRYPYQIWDQEQPPKNVLRPPVQMQAGQAKAA